MDGLGFPRLTFLCLLSVLMVCFASGEYDIQSSIPTTNTVGIITENSKCRSSGSPGICRKLTDCPVAMESVKKWHKHDFKRCGFEGFNEIVCCPTTSFREPDPFTEWGRLGESTPGPPDSEEEGQVRKFEQACRDTSKQLERGVIFHIIGGEDAKEKEFPHMAVLGSETEEGMSWTCGASVISNRYLLTAAHCFTGREPPTRVLLGVTLLNDTDPIENRIKNITMHEGYDTDHKHHDIAIVELSEPVTFSDKVLPACLYAKDDDPLGLIVTGWGKKSIGLDDDRSNILQKAKLVAVPIKQCNDIYVTRTLGSRTIESTQLCAGANSSDSCWGDSGGPLQIQEKSGVYSIVGVISYGAGCGGSVPGVYTRISKYLDWIENIVWR